jgi:hypothetical protein
MKDLQYFVGKLCSVFTTPMNRDFRSEAPHDYPKALYKYFMGVVESVTPHGLLLTQASTGLKTYFYHNQIVAIAEEELLDPNNPDDAAIIEKFQVVPPIAQPAPQVNIPDSPYADADAMMEISQQLRNKYGPVQDK